MRVGRDADRRTHVQIQFFFLAKQAGAQIIPQSSRYHQCGIFSRLGQQNYKLVATVTKCVINQAKLSFDEITDFRQQLASHQVPMRVVDLLEVVKIDE